MNFSPARMAAWLVTLALAAACAPAPEGPAMPTVHSAVAASRTVTGDTVAISIFRVKPEKREQYERFLHEVFWPMGRRLGETDPVMRRVFGQTRILHPAAPNEDGTCSYAFLFDPWETGGEYGIETLLKTGFGEDSVRRKEAASIASSLRTRSRVNLTTFLSSASPATKYGLVISPSSPPSHASLITGGPTWVLP